MTVKRAVTLRELSEAGVRSIYAPAPNATYGAGVNILDTNPAAVLTGGPDERRKLFITRLTILDGPDKGKTMYVSVFDIPGFEVAVQPFIPRAEYGFNNVKDGDRIKVDNRDFIALMYYYRHGGAPIERR